MRETYPSLTFFWIAAKVDNTKSLCGSPICKEHFQTACSECYLGNDALFSVHCCLTWTSKKHDKKSIEELK